MKTNGIHPKDLVLTKFPVIPPVYRPVYPGPNGGPPMIADLNNLYKDLLMTNEALHELKDFPDEHKEDLRKALHNAAGAVIGVCDPVNDKSKKQELKGGLTQLVGAKNSKEGFFHKKILYRTQDLTGRGTILPDPNLHVDECKIPEDMAKEMYKPFIVKRLVEAGLEPSKALKEANDHTEMAQKALKDEMEHRPLLLNRAPTLHKYGILAFKPQAVKGKSIFIPPLVISGFGADFDGDSVSGDTHVVVRDSAGKVHLVQIKYVE
jgi:DNA-directed RNA polymerase subunit beta'